MSDSHAASIAFAAVVTIVGAVTALWRPPPPARIALGRAPGPSRATVRGRPIGAGRARHLLLPLACLTTIGAVAGVAAGGATTALILVHRWSVVRRARRAGIAAVEVAYPDLVDLLVLTIKSGCSPLQAFVALGDIAPTATRSAVEAVVRDVGSGARFADAVGGLRAPPPRGLGTISQPLADALALADRHGTPLPPILDRLALEAREHRRRRAEISARQLPIRLAFPLVGCTLPSFVLLTIVPLMAGTFSTLRGTSP